MISTMKSERRSEILLVNSMLQWKINHDKYIGDRAFIRLYKTKRFFNLIFSIDYIQEDGYMRATVIIVRHAVQLVIPFNNKRHFKYIWRLVL